MARMNKDYKEALQKCLDGLAKTLPSILDILLVKMNAYFLDHQQEVIKTKASSVDKVVEFIKILRTMQDDAFFAFLSALDQLNYRHMANEIRLMANIPVQPPPHNICSDTEVNMDVDQSPSSQFLAEALEPMDDEETLRMDEEPPNNVEEPLNNVAYNIYRQEIPNLHLFSSAQSTTEEFIGDFTSLQYEGGYNSHPNSTNIDHFDHFDSLPLVSQCEALSAADLQRFVNPFADEVSPETYQEMVKSVKENVHIYSPIQGYSQVSSRGTTSNKHFPLESHVTTPNPSTSGYLSSESQAKHHVDEITKGAAVAIAFERAVKQGVREANQFKIVMLGPEGAGKTSTVLSLLGEDFQPHQPSTVGAETHKAGICNSFTVDRICVYNWKTTEFQFHLEEISTHYKHEMKQEMTKVLSNRTESHKEYNKVSESAGLEVLQSEVQFPDSNVRVVIYDLGGQEIYYEVHYLFLASHDVIFLTFNASVDLDEPVVSRHRYTMLRERKQTKKTLTTFQVIEATLHTIYSRCGKKGIKGSLSYRNPTVIMIATHSANLTENEREKITDTLLRRLPGTLQDHFPEHRSHLIHFIDNCRRDTDVFDHLKAVAVKAAGCTLTEKRPIAYLKFEEKILTLSQEESEISKERAFKIATEVGLEATDDALLTLLEYYALKGILLYYPDIEALKNTIYISPQRVSNLVTCVIKTHDYGELRPRADLRDKYKRFDDFGLLEEEVLDDMLEKRNMLENVESGSSKGYSKGNVLGLLKKFDLTTKIDRSTKFENEDCTYLTPDSGQVFFVPSMLVYNTTEVYKTLEGHTDNTILYYFPDKFLPDIVFNHVLIRTTKWCVAEGHRIRCVSNGIGVFDFSNNTQSFALQCCSDIHYIKCYISVCKQAARDKDLWQQRQDLFGRTKEIIDEVHEYYIGKAKKPVVCIDCPHHREECAPHIPFDTIKSKAWCTKVNQLISEDTYKLLLEPTDQCGDTAAAHVQLVKGAKVIDQITDKEATPTIKELYRYVTNSYADDWEHIGIELDLKRETLKIISKNHQDCITCFKRTLDEWLTSTSDASWRTLEVAITNVNRSRLGLEPVNDIYVERAM